MYSNVSYTNFMLYYVRYSDAVITRQLFYGLQNTTCWVIHRELPSWYTTTLYSVNHVKYPPPLRAFACFCFTVNYRQTLITTCFAKILQVLYLVHYYHTIHRTGVLYTEKSSLLLFVSVIHKLFLQVCELYITILAGDG